jgi:hypothetical protein
MVANAEGSQQNNPQINIRAKEHEKRAEVIEKHLHWLNSRECRSWSERATWSPTGSESETKVVEITWGRSSAPPKQEALPNPTIWDEIGSEAFEQALKTQEEFNQGKIDPRPLSHVELDVQGLDAKRNRVRVQRTLEIELKLSTEASEQGNIETTTMKLNRVLVISNPPSFSLPPNKPRDREPYHALLEQLAQHEVNKAFDERNYFLREVFAQDVDHVRKRRNSTIADHQWSFQRPKLCIRGPDGTMISLKEERTDSAVADDVILTYAVVIEEVRREGRSHLLDLPIEGSESERLIRQAKWTISSAIDRYLAEGSAERFVMDKWVDGTFLPRF